MCTVRKPGCVWPIDMQGHLPPFTIPPPPSLYSAQQQWVGFIPFFNGLDFLKKSFILDYLQTINFLSKFRGLGFLIIIHQFHVKFHLVCLCQLVGCFIGWFCRLGARLVGLLVAKETPPKATSIHPQVHIAPFSILVKNLQNALLDITTKDVTTERSLPAAFIA